MIYIKDSVLTDLQEGSRIYTPVRLGFPRETMGYHASYDGHKIPDGMVSKDRKGKRLCYGLWS